MSEKSGKPKIELPEKAEKRKKSEKIKKPESVKSEQLPEELALHLEDESLPEGWTQDDVLASLKISTLEDKDAFCKKLAKRLGKEDWEVERVLSDVKEKVFSSLGEYMSWNHIDLGEWDKVEAGVNKKEEFNNIRKNELAEDWAEVARARDSVHRIESDLRKADKKIPELKDQRQVLKNSPPEKPSFGDLLRDVVRPWKDTSMARYNASLDSAEEKMREINEKIKKLKEKRDTLVSEEETVKSEYEELERLYDAKADAVFEEKKPLLEKEIESKKAKLEKIIEYLYNDIHCHQLSVLTSRYETALDEAGIQADYGNFNSPVEEPEFPDYLTDTAERLAFIKKELKDPDGHAREILFSTVDENEAKDIIKDLVGRG